MTEFNLHDFLPYKLSILSQTVSQLIAQEYENRYNLTMHQWRCLVIINSHENVTAKDICGHTLLDKMTVSRAVRSLANRKLITLVPSKDDARKQMISLSAIGLRIYDEVIPIAQKYESTILSTLTIDEKEGLDSTIKKLIFASHNLKFDK